MEEFTKIDDNNVKSDKGFSVQVGLPWYVQHRNIRGESRICAELLMPSPTSGKHRVVLYIKDVSTYFPKGIDDVERDGIVADTMRALLALGIEPSRFP